MSKHTPGPWTMGAKEVNEEYGHTGRRVYAGSLWVASVHGRHVEVPFKHIEANARLIAAAPDLLEALKELLAYSLDGLGQLSEDWNVVKDARAAIARAEELIDG